MFLHKKVQFKLDEHNLHFFSNKSDHVNFFSYILRTLLSQFLVNFSKQKGSPLRRAFFDKLKVT